MHYKFSNSQKSDWSDTVNESISDILWKKKKKYNPLAANNYQISWTETKHSQNNSPTKNLKSRQCQSRIMSFQFFFISTTYPENICIPGTGPLLTVVWEGTGDSSEFIQMKKIIYMLWYLSQGLMYT